jgi:two-component system chemotaxis response regulator CheY
MVSTEGRDEDRKRAYASGANLYLVKPIRQEQLIAMIAVLLGEMA